MSLPIRRRPALMPAVARPTAIKRGRMARNTRWVARCRSIPRRSRVTHRQRSKRWTPCAARRSHRMNRRPKTDALRPMPRRKRPRLVLSCINQMLWPPVNKPKRQTKPQQQSRPAPVRLLHRMRSKHLDLLLAADSPPVKHHKHAPRSTSSPNGQLNWRLSASSCRPMPCFRGPGSHLPGARHINLGDV